MKYVSTIDMIDSKLYYYILYIQDIIHSILFLYSISNSDNVNEPGSNNKTSLEYLVCKWSL